MRGIPGVLLCTLLLGACEQDGAQDAALAAGERLYQRHCAGCHRGAGEGDFLRGVPPVRYSTLGQAEMAALILGHGRVEGAQMPTFSRLPQADAAAIAGYVRHGLGLR